MENDSPIRIPQQDRLNRFPFAQQLATGLIEGYVQSKEALVVGIHGPWGSGKSSLVNLMVRAIRGHYYRTEEEKGVVLTFNPWMFSGQEELQLIFLRELAARLYAFSEETKKIAQQVSRLLGRLEELAKPIAAFIPYGGWAQQAIGFGKKVTEQISTPKDVQSLKDKIDQALQENEIRLYITIDDIDRLTFAEIEHIFQLVKLNANFANTVFILAYDQEVVINALDQKFAGRGQQYLEKIVQVDYGLPKMNRHTLKELLRERMEALLEKLGITPSLEELIEENIALWQGIERCIRNIRDINRYINAVQLRLGGVWKEVDIMDFLVLEALRVFDGAAYDWIWNNKGIFIGPSKPTNLIEDQFWTENNLKGQEAFKPIDWNKMDLSEHTVSLLRLLLDRGIFSTKKGPSSDKEIIDINLYFKLYTPHSTLVLHPSTKISAHGTVQ